MADNVQYPDYAGTSDATIHLGQQRVKCVLFMPDEPPRAGSGYQVQDTGRGDIVHRATDDLSKTAHIRAELITQIQTARHKVMFCSFLFADDEIVQALCEAAERLHGGVYILTALGKHLRAEVLELDDEIDTQTARLQERAKRHEEHLRRLAQAGAWLRSAEDCHAKFCVTDDACAIITSANSTKEAYEINPEDGLTLHQPLAACEFGRLFAHIWQHLTTLESLPGVRLDVHSLPLLNNVPWRPLVGDNNSRPAATLRKSETSLLDCAVDVINRASNHLTIATYSFMGMEDHPVGAALQRAVERGVIINLLVQPRNHIEAQRLCLNWLYRLAPKQVHLHGHKRTHTKSIVADNQCVLLWTGNLDARHGWYDGIEVGVVVEDSGVAAALSRWTSSVMQRRTHTTLISPSVRQLVDAGFPIALPGEWELMLPAKTRTESLIHSLQHHPVELIEISGQLLLRSADGLGLHIKVDYARRRIDVVRLQQHFSNGNARNKGWLAESTLKLHLPNVPVQQSKGNKKGPRS